MPPLSIHHINRSYGTFYRAPLEQDGALLNFTSLLYFYMLTHTNTKTQCLRQSICLGDTSERTEQQVPVCFNESSVLDSVEWRCLSALGPHDKPGTADTGVQSNLHRLPLTALVYETGETLSFLCVAMVYINHHMHGTLQGAFLCPLGESIYWPCKRAGLLLLSHK